MSTLHPRTVLAAAFLIGLATSVSAAENVLGLPSPRDAARPGALLLHGGGSISNDAFDRFVTLAGGRQAKIVLIPSAGYRLADYASRAEFESALRRRFGSWVGLESTGAARSVRFLYTDDPADANDVAFVRPLTEATGVWFSGGAQARLHYRFVGASGRPTRFQVALREVLERGGVVGGTSAGMAALPEIMTLTQNGQGTFGPMNAVAAPGLGLCTGAIVEQHFDGRNGRLERFTGLLRDSNRLDKMAGRKGAGATMLGLAVEEGTGLVLQDDRLEVVGRSEAHVFVKAADRLSITWHTLSAGHKAELKRAGRGETTLVRRTAAR